MDPRAVDEIRKMQEQGFGKTCGFRLTSAGAGMARIEAVVTPALCNLNGTLHGGAIATLVDEAGTMAIVTADREARPGVTTDLNVSYFAPALAGSIVIAEAEVLKIGKRLAFVAVDIRRGADGILVAQGRMTTFQG